VKEVWLIAAIALVQVACAVFFVSDIILTILDARSAPISWQTRELLEIGAAVGLFAGMLLGWLALRRAIFRRDEAELRLRRASSAFLDVVNEQFTEWGLTPAERDVAMFAIKGLSTSEIAELRKTSEGTIKAQTNAIYRKAGVTGRPQLLSLFVEDLMSETPVHLPAD
jgi:DNA-binding CsgD family transcriptional regulator